MSKELLSSNERDINRHLIALKYDICRKSEDCQPCQGLREKSIEIIERLQREVDGYRKMALLREQEANALRSTVEPKALRASIEGLAEAYERQSSISAAHGGHSAEAWQTVADDLRSLLEQEGAAVPPKANCPECYGVGHLATFIDGARVQDTPCPRGCSSVTRENESSRERVAPCVRELSERGTAQPPSANQIAWLVEGQENGRAVWYTANFQWTTDANEAMWFVRKLDAELFCWNTEVEANAVEHMFCSLPASTETKGEAL